MVAGGCAVGGSEMAIPGVTEGFSDRTDSCEGLRESIVARLRVLAQKPAIAKVVVALNKLDAVSSP